MPGGMKPNNQVDTASFTMCKSKVHSRTGHEGPEGEKRYSSILS